MVWYTWKPATSQPATTQFTGIQEDNISSLRTTEEETRAKVEQHFEAYCKQIGILPKDVQHLLKNYQAERKKWERLSMGTLYQRYNDKERLPLFIYIDCRMTEEEMSAIDQMSLAELQEYCQYENPMKLTQFCREAPNQTLTRAYLAERAKYSLRLTVEEIKEKGTLVGMARHWCRIRPEAWSNSSRVDLMRLFRE